MKIQVENACPRDNHTRIITHYDGDEMFLDYAQDLTEELTEKWHIKLNERKQAHSSKRYILCIAIATACKF